MVKVVIKFSIHVFLMFCYGISRSLSYFQGVHDLHRTVCVYATGVGLTNLLTNTIKLYVGYLRPIF